MEPAAVLVAAFQVHVGRPAVAGAAAAGCRATSPTRTRRRGCPCPFRTPCRRSWGRRCRAGEIQPLLSGTRSWTRRRRRPSPRFRWPRCRAAARRISCRRRPAGGRPSRAGARCTSRGGFRSCWRCVPRPRPGSQSTPLDGAPAPWSRRSAVVHGDEPLGGGAEDDRLLAAPAMGVGVADRARSAAGCRSGAGPRRCARWPEDLQPLVWAGGLVEAAVGHTGE